MLTPYFDYNFLVFYANNYNIHFIFQLFFETIFIIFFLVSFFPKKLPEQYYDDVVFKYKHQVFLIANIYEEENYIKRINDSIDMNYSGKLKISNLTFDSLRTISKKKKYPILFINPFVSTKNNKKFFNEIHLGIVGKICK